jgi:AcrR family transcriptional regulator
MPRIVDHQQRRAEVARIVLAVIDREGAEAATVRRIAQEGGFSVGVLTHYFRGKDEILAFSFDWISEQTFLELDRRLAAAPPGLARLREALEFMLPGASAQSYPGVWMGLWGTALRNPALTGAHSAFYARWRRCLRRQLAQACALGQVAPPVSQADATDLLVAAVDGLWIGAAFEPRRYGAARRRRLVHQLMHSVLGAAP